MSISNHRLFSHRFSLLSMLAACIFCILVVPCISFALGTLQGIVRDESGHAIPGALVSSSDGSTGISGDNGFYSMAHSSGTWIITASAPGYTDQAIPGIVIEDDATTAVELDLAGSPLRVTDAHPRLEKMGEEVHLNILGNEFDENTRVSVIPDSGNKARIISSLNIPVDTGTAIGVALDIFVTNGTAYVAMEEGSLSIIDVSNPVAPRMIGEFPTSGESHGVTVIGSTAFVADGSNGLLLIDITNPAIPVFKGRADTDDARHVTVVGSTAYVADGTSGLQVIDVSTPSTPDIIGSYNTPDFAQDVTVVGTMAYVADGASGLQVIDVTDPENPELTGSVETEDEAYGVAVVEGIAYMACYSRLQTIDVSDPSNPTLSGWVDTSSRALDVVVDNDIAYVAVEDNGMQIFNVKDPEKPEIISFVDTQGDTSGLTVLGETAYLADGWGGLQTVDIRHPGQPFQIGLVNTPGKAKDITVKNATAYVADFDYGLQIIDVSDPTLPVITGSVEPPDNYSYALGLQVKGNKAYLVYEEGFQIIDISNPKAPEVVGTYNVTDPEIPEDSEDPKDKRKAQGIAVADNKAYVAYVVDMDEEDDKTDGSGFLIIDINDSDPENPQYIGKYFTAALDSVVDLVVVGSHVFMACSESGLVIIDVISDPENPQYISEYDTPGSAEGVVVVHGLVYIADRFEGLQIVDISDPAAPNFEGSVEPPDYGYAANISVIDDMAYLADGSAGLHAIDVSVPASPVIIGTISAPGEVIDMTIIGDIAYIASDSAGLVIVPVPFTVQSPTLVSDSLSSLTLSSPRVSGNYTIRVYNDEHYNELPGAVTFTDDINLLTSRAIIVAGGGPFASGDIWEETKAYANYAYESLIYQGYQDEDIYYLTDETGAPGRDAAATRENLKSEITGEETKGASGLLLYLVDHGASEEFQIRGGAAPQNVSAYELDSWLDTLQKNMEGKVVFIYDACKSGSFISTGSSAADAAGSSLISSLQSKVTPDEELSGPEETAVSTLLVPDNTSETSMQSNESENTFLPAIYLLLSASGGDQDRIIITSSGSNQIAYFLNTTHSFSYHFWSTLSGKTGNEVNLEQAFEEASSTMSLYQTAQLDANGNGKANEEEDSDLLKGLKGTIYALRRQYSSSLTKPVVGIVSDYQTIQGASIATLMARSVYDIDGDRIDRVWAEIIPPYFNPHQGNLTVTDIPTVELGGPDGDGVYQGEYTDFDQVGAYIINIYAEDAHGIYSQPKTTLVIRE